MADPLAASGTGPARPRQVIHLVPHTHWDREWYLPFQAFRLRLVELIDGLLDEMESDPQVRFTLDGQTATVDDYLELRPESAERVARLVAERRLAVGPWAILMDEFLVSGETIVRNLELGLRRATELGGAMRIGYLPDMFGHIAQMPQILARAGIRDAVVWRGVPHAVKSHAFTWRSPDGSEVRCEYLYRGYGNARDVFNLPDRIERKLDGYVAQMQPWFGRDEILAMYGEDHSLPLPGYGAMVEAFNAGQSRYDIRVETLDGYIGATRAASNPELTWTGELRSGARANILMGVASHRVDVKQAAARAERWLERRAEPLISLHGARWPGRELALAWRAVIESSAHDSVCACSAEPTVQQVLARYATAEQIARGLVERTMRSIASHSPARAWVAWNPSPAPRSDLIEIELSASERGELRASGGSPVETQEIGVKEVVLDDRPVAAAEVVRYLGMRMHARELYTYNVNGFALETGAGHAGLDTLTIEVSRVADPAVLDIDALLDELGAIAAAADARAPSVTWRLRVVARAQRRLLARVGAPALGLATVTPDGPSADASGPADGEDRAGGGPARVRDHVLVGPRRLANDVVAVEIAGDGTLDIEGPGIRLTGVGRIVDGGDAGDSYNYAPPARDEVVDEPLATTLEVVEHGPLRGVIAVDRTYPWPVGLRDQGSSRAAETAATLVRTTVELRAGEPFVRLRIDFDNQSRDHRVRFHIPLAQPSDRSWTEGQFAIVERGLTMEGGHGEHPLPTFPAHGLAAADGVVALLDHLTEMELVDGRELALTLLRSTGLISRDMHPWRAEPAGPVIAAPGGQGIGPRTVTFALLPHRGPPSPDVLECLEAYRGPFVVERGTGSSQEPPVDAAGLAIEGDGVVLTSLRRHDGGLELRLVNETGDPRQATITGPFTEARLATLLGEPRAAQAVRDGSLTLALAPWEIVTVLLARPMGSG